jgi:hypothetical protein
LHGTISYLNFEYISNENPLLFVGYESGAIGAFKIYYDDIKNTLTYQ